MELVPVGVVPGNAGCAGSVPHSPARRKTGNPMIDELGSDGLKVGLGEGMEKN